MTLENDEGAEGEGAEGAEASKLAEMQERLDKLAGLVADPDVAAVLAAKEKGRSLRLVVGEEQQGAQEPEAPPELSADELDGMSNSQLADALLGRMGFVVKQSLESLGVTQRLDEVQNALASGRQEKLTAEAATLQKKYPDLLAYKDQLVELAKTGLKLEEAYLVARVRSGKGLPNPVSSSERPTGITIRPVEKPKAARSGSRGFEQDLAEVLDRLELHI